MAQTLADGTFACSVCGQKYYSSQHADACRDSHELLYIPMSKTELNRLLNALILDKVDMVPESLIGTLRKYAKYIIISDVRNGK